MDRALVEWARKRKKMGLKVGDDTLFTLYFADDQIVMAGDDDYLEYMVRKLNVEYEFAGLTMNLAKCEYLIIENDEIINLELENGTIKGVDNSKYLEVIFNKHENSREEIKERINKEHSVIRTLKLFAVGENVK